MQGRGSGPQTLQAEACGRFRGLRREAVAVVVDLEAENGVGLGVTGRPLLPGEREAAACAARLLHQTSFIASSTHGKTTMQLVEGAEWIVQSTISPDGPDGADSYVVST